MQWAEWRIHRDARAGRKASDDCNRSCLEQCKQSKAQSAGDTQFDDWLLDGCPGAVQPMSNGDNCSHWELWEDDGFAADDHFTDHEVGRYESWGKWRGWGSWSHCKGDSADYWSRHGAAGRARQKSTQSSDGSLPQSIDWSRDPKNADSFDAASVRISSEISSWKNCSGYHGYDKKRGSTEWCDYGRVDESNVVVARRRSEPPPNKASAPMQIQKESEWCTRSIKGSVDRQTKWQCRDGSRWNTPKRCRSRDSANLPAHDQVVDRSPEFTSKYELGKRIAAGFKGVIFLATQRSNDTTVVVKRPNKPTDTRDFDRLVDKRHPNILRVFECFTGPMETFVVMEYYAGGDLFHAVDRHRTSLSQAWVARVFRQILSGVKYLHDFGESHNDLKLENMLLDRHMAKPDDVPRVVVADFGCAAPAGSRSSGDPRYRAPETFSHAPFGFETDIWALGVCLYELLTGGLLIHIQQQNLCGWREFESYEGGALCDKFMKIMRSRPPTPVDIDNIDGEDVQDLLGDLLHLYPHCRMTMESALAHPWLALACSHRVDHHRCKAQKISSDSEDEKDLERPRSPRKFGGC